MLRLASLNAIYSGLLTVDEYPSLMKLVHYFDNGVDDLLLNCLKSYLSNSEEHIHTSSMLLEYTNRCIKRGADGALPNREPNVKEILLGHINLYVDMHKAKGVACEVIDSLIHVFQYQVRRSSESVRR